MYLKCRNLISLIALVSLLTNCSEREQPEIITNLAGANDTVLGSNSLQEATNPFFEESPLYLHYPQFDLIQNIHYLPAFERGMTEQLGQIDVIVNQVEQPNFQNTILALELSGQLLDRVSRVFYAMASAHTSDGIRALEQQLAPRLASHQDNILLNRDLFLRIEKLYGQRDNLELDPEPKRLLEKYYIQFVRAGAALSLSEQRRMNCLLYTSPSPRDS